MDRLFPSRWRQAGPSSVAILAAVLFAVVAMGGGAGWGATLPVDSAQAPQTFGITLPQHVAKSLKPVRLAPSEQAGLALAAIPEVRLAAIDRDAVLKADAMNERTGQTKLLRFAVARDVRVTAANGSWHDAGGGTRLWVGDVVSSEALGLRLHFNNVNLPAGAELAVYAVHDQSSAGGTVANGFPGFDPERQLELHQASDETAGSTDFWTGTLPGERARIEYLAPAGAAAELPFAVDSLQHVYLDPVARLAKSLIQREAGDCHNDVTCFPEWADAAKSVAGLGILVAGGSAFCTGQLINDQAGDFTPYFLTAHHCLSTQKDAKNSEFFWLYQTDTCNGTPPAIESVPHSQGATLVSSNASSDYTLMIVEGALPDSLFWSGWTSTPVANGTDAAGIHHPEADFKRISFGFKDESSACPSANFDRISWTSGVTEPGSSGSGIFRVDTHQLFGQLLGGPSFCGADAGSLFDCYGAFAATYPQVKNPLRKGWDDASEPNNTCAQARIVATGTLKNRIVKVLDPDWYKLKVRPGKTITVRVNFVDANGDVDLDLFGADCGAEPLATSRTSNNQEIVEWTNRTGQAAFFAWKVYLASDTRNTYSLTVSIR
ncbi:MAG TPA: trypsin-like peptidase domain-containing protein [Thermoanaerobaculia bacterium]|nr:trypsin-like peptidase domain-containing protein [Thermoanaerobaculia bacterium]